MTRGHCCGKACASEDSALCTLAAVHSCNCNGCSLRGASKLWCTGDSAVHHEVASTQAGAAVQLHHQQGAPVHQHQQDQHQCKCTSSRGIEVQSSNAVQCTLTALHCCICPFSVGVGALHWREPFLESFRLPRRKQC